MARRQAARGEYVPTNLQPSELASLARSRSEAQLGLQQTQQTQLLGALLDYGQYTAFDLPNLQAKIKAGREALPAGYAARNVLNSGIYQGALQTYGEESQRQVGELQYGFMSGLLNRYLTVAQSQQQHDLALQQIALDEQARREELAHEIRGLV